jgi:hypothetical protein
MPTPAVERAAVRYVLHVDGSVEDAGHTLPAAAVSGAFRAEYRTHWARLVIAEGTGSAARCRLRQAAVRQAPEQYRALWACRALRGLSQCSQRRVFMLESLTGCVTAIQHLTCCFSIEISKADRGSAGGLAKAPDISAGQTMIIRSPESRAPRGANVPDPQDFLILGWPPRVILARRLILTRGSDHPCSILDRPAWTPRKSIMLASDWILPRPITTDSQARSISRSVPHHYDDHSVMIKRT